MFCRKDFLAEQLQDVLSLRRKQLLDILAGKQAVECETVQAFGTPITVEVSATDITMLDEEKYLVILQDVTSRHQLQRLRKDFVAMITHDLRTPLTSIDLSTFLIEEGLLRTGISIPEVVMESVQSTRRSSTRLLSLVNDLLDYEKLESRSFALNFARTTVSAIVEQSVLEVQPIALDRQITIGLPAKNFEFQADERRIVQVMVNLLSNAIKFSPDGSNISIAVACRNEQIEFRIIDNGRGIPDDLKQVVFERYKQINKEDGQRGKGTGLGLPICKALVEGHDGEIGVFDNPEQGSTFWFRLPQQR
jgi:signal transduction histidine kinase